MNIKETLENIESLYDKKGRISSNFIKYCYEKHNDIYNDIHKTTSFLKNNPKLSQRIKVILEGVSAHPKCVVCDKWVMFNPHKTKSKIFSKFCSNYCAIRSEERKTNTIETNIERYGKSYHQQTDIGQNRRQATNLERYGFISPASNSYIRTKIQNTNITKYGHHNIFGSEYGKEKIKQTNLKKYGNYSYTTSLLSTYAQDKLNDVEWLKEQNSLGYTLFDIGQLLKCSPSCVHQHFQKYDIQVIRQKQSSFEREISSILSKHTEVLKNTKINDIEYDLLLPEYNILIECDGIYWHGENTTGRDRYYHLNKTINGMSNNMNVIHIWEHEWTLNSDIVTSMLLSKINKLVQKKQTRRGSVRKIQNKEASEFINVNHIQGKCNASYNYGLFIDEELIACMSISKSRFSKNRTQEYELIRFCVLKYNIVNGAFSKMLKFVATDLNLTNLITFADLRYSIGNVYKQTGFTFEYNTTPSYWYFKTNKCLELYNRYNFQKHKLKDKLKTFNPQLTEWENMKLNGYDRIWDCGNSKWNIHF